jgi:hypothetical protein
MSTKNTKTTKYTTSATLEKTQQILPDSFPSIFIQVLLKAESQNMEKKSTIQNNLTERTVLITKMSTDITRVKFL